MLNSLLLICALICYLCATLLIAGYIRANANKPGDKKSLTVASILGVIGVTAHLLYAYNTCFVGTSLNFSTHSMLILISGILIFIFLLFSIAMPIRRLGILVFPISMISLLLTLTLDKNVVSTLSASASLTGHILISILAFSIITIATVQGLLYLYQEKQLKNRAAPTMLMALPPLQTMELLLFRLITIGFIFLTLTLFSGAIFSQSIFGHAFVFKHHTILAFLGWLVFAVLLFKRYRHGLRGPQAVIFTVIGFMLIQLGYFGTKLVSDIITIN